MVYSEKMKITKKASGILGVMADQTIQGKPIVKKTTLIMKGLMTLKDNRKNEMKNVGRKNENEEDYLKHQAMVREQQDEENYYEEPPTPEPIIPEPAEEPPGVNNG